MALMIDELNKPDKRGPGRPTEEKKNYMVQCRVSAEISRFIYRNCLINHLTESEFIRSILQSALDEELERARIRREQRELEHQQKLELYRQNKAKGKYS